ncbi:MAG: ferritin family protein [Candidatus Brocadiia bacterium]
MKNNKYDPEDARWLRIAIASEKKALRQYLEYALRTTDRSGKDMFLKLARDEFSHMAALEKELGRMQDGRAWERIKIPASDIEKLAPRLKKTGLNADQASKDETQALGLAIKDEDKASGFYRAKACQTSSSTAKVLLNRLADMEQAHSQILRAELDNIRQTGFWMNTREISFEMA